MHTSRDLVLPNREETLRDEARPCELSTGEPPVCEPSTSDLSPGEEIETAAESAGRKISLSRFDEGELEAFGRILDRRPHSLDGATIGMALCAKLLLVRSREGWTAPLKANPAQVEFEKKRGQHNIVLKARQMGITTWASARFLLRTITRPGTLTLQVAHTREAAEEIFRIVHRFVGWLPEELRQGPLRTSRANVRQIAFPVLYSQYKVVTAGDRNAGRGLTVQNLHCSELARWPGNPAETLAGLRAAMAPDAELILESTPDGVGGCFHEEWLKAAETGMVQHFFPWWKEKSYRARAVNSASLSEEERRLMEQNKLTLAHIGFRRQMRANFRGLAAQEFAESAESCFRASGEPVFELEPIEARLAELSLEAAERRMNDTIEIWLPAVEGKQYLVSVDPAGGGIRGDYSAIEVLELETGLQCAEFAGHLGGLELARLACGLANEYNRALLVVERNNHGSGLLAYLEAPCAYGHIYFQGKQAGWLTTSLSRPAAIGKLASALVDEPQRFMSRRLLAECRSFVRLADGSSGARAGTHDDRVMAMAIGLAARAKMLEKRKSSF
jgi:hypothetical protein